jgi:capsid protein
VKDATAAAMRIASGLSTQAEECAADGKDWREVNKQREKELQDSEAKQLPPPGISIADLPPTPAEAASAAA